MKLIAAYVLLGFMAFFLINQHCEIRELKRNQAIGLQPAEYNLPDDVVTFAQMDEHIMKVINRVGPDSVFISETYVPAESSVEYVVRVDTVALGELEAAQALLARLELEVETLGDSAAVEELKASIAELRAAIVTTEIKFNTHGTCFVPEAGVALDADLQVNVEAGARLYYWNRYGIGIHALAEIPEHGNDTWSGAVGPFIDGKLPWWDNVAVFGGFEYDFGKKETQASAGAHVYFN